MDKRVWIQGLQSVWRHHWIRSQPRYVRCRFLYFWFGIGLQDGGNAHWL